MNLSRLRNSFRTAFLVTCLGWSIGSRADEMAHFPFDEGSGFTTTDTASGLTGVFGTVQDPFVDKVELVDISPSGAAGDRSIVTSGEGFLMADDSENKVLDIGEGPITMETWMYIDPFSPTENAEGILAYGGAYKMGLRGGYQVFTLYGIRDVTNTVASFVPAGQWVHLAAAWDPGVGVHFYVDGTEYFVAETAPAANEPIHNYLSLASEGLGNNSVATFDRMRIHNALLTAAEIDSDAANPKAPLASTIVSYNFNEADFPVTNEVSPSLPSMFASDVLPSLTGPSWTSDSPSGAEADYALSFNLDNPPVKEVVTVDTSAAPLNLWANSTNYTLQAWVKVPNGTFDERRVIYRSGGSAPRVSLSVNVDRTLHTTLYGTEDFTSDVPIPNDNQWHHIAAVMENFEQVHFYLDGVLRQTVPRTRSGTPSGSSTEDLLIGKESETRYYRGLLDRVIIHNHALAQAELDYPAAPGLPVFDSFESHPVDVLTDAGSTVTFSAFPTSNTAATYQWYRSDALGGTGTALSGETDTTLTLENVSEADEGYYYLQVTNEAGTAQSYPAQLALRSSLALPGTGFEEPTYTSGPVENQDHWTINRNGETARVLTTEQIEEYLEAAGLTPGQTVHSGNQALLVSGPGLSSAAVRPILSLEDESNVTVDVWTRPLGPGDVGAPIGNVFMTVENSGGTRAAAFRFDDAENSIDYGSDVTGVWQPTGLSWDENTWYNIRLELDYAARTYDMFINGSQVNTSPIPFYDPDSDSLNQIRIFRGANQAGMIVDDLSVTGPGGGEAPELQIQEEGDQLVISWPASAEGFTLQATDELVPANWTTVAHETVGAENRAVIDPTGDSRFFRLVN